MRESGLTLEPGYLLVITSKAINFPLCSCPGRERERVRTDVCYQLKLQLKVAYYLVLGHCIMSTTNHDSSLFMTVFVSYLAIILVYNYYMYWSAFEWALIQIGLRIIDSCLN